jgi:hypothetical protein
MTTSCDHLALYKRRMKNAGFRRILVWCRTNCSTSWLRIETGGNATAGPLSNCCWGRRQSGKTSHLGYRG